MNSSSLNAARAFLVTVILQCWRPLPIGSVWEWAEKHVFLTPKQSPAMPGWYSTRLTPYVRTVLDFINDPDWDELIVEKSSQSGFTEAVLCLIRYLIANKPMRVLYAIDSQGEARKICKMRLEPSIRDFLPPGLSAVMSERDITSLLIDMPHMSVDFIGGHSSGQYANKTAGLGVLDEMDEHPKPMEGDTENIDKMRERVKQVGKLIGLGRPTTEKGVTHREYKTGTCEKFFVKCPHCQHPQELVPEGIEFGHCKDLVGEWDLNRVLAETYYRCENEQCSGARKITEDQRAAMVETGEWRITNPKHRPRKRSIHISDLYSPFTTLGELAVEFLSAQQSGDQRKLQTVINSRWGRPFRQEKAEVSEEQVLALRGAYSRGECPFAVADVKLLGVTTDRQRDVFKSIKFAATGSGSIAVIDYAIHLSERELLDWAQSPITKFAGQNEAPRRAQIGLIDEGFNAKKEIRDFVQSSSGFYFASKGRGGVQVKAIVAESKTPHNGEDMIVYHYDDDDFQKQLYIARIQNLPLIKSGRQKTPRLWLPNNVDPEFTSELRAMRLVERELARGFTKWEWVKDASLNNDFGDCVKEALVLWYIAGPVILADERLRAEGPVEISR